MFILGPKMPRFANFGAKQNISSKNGLRQFCFIEPKLRQKIRKEVMRLSLSSSVTDGQTCVHRCI